MDIYKGTVTVKGVARSISQDTYLIAAQNFEEATEMIRARAAKDLGVPEDNLTVAIYTVHTFRDLFAGIKL